MLNEPMSAHKGAIIQFLGDSFFAMWNAPASDNDHVEENACLSALAMKIALAEFNDQQRLKGLPNSAPALESTQGSPWSEMLGRLTAPIAVLIDGARASVSPTDR